MSIVDKIPVSVIVIARNSESDIKDCLESIQENSPEEVILVDGNSTDKTVEIARKYTDKIYSDGGKGQSFARQLGAERATQEFIAYVDSDVILPEGALSTLLNEFRHSEFVSIRAQVFSNIEHPNYWQWAQIQHRQLRHVDNNIGTLACVFKREIILKYPFDLSAAHLDDISLGFKLLKEGYRFGTSSAVVYQNPPPNLKSFINYCFLIGRWSPRAIKKFGIWHPEFWPPLHIFYWLGVCLIKRKPKLIPYFIVNGMAQTAGMIKGYFEILGKLSTKTSHNGH